MPLSALQGPAGETWPSARGGVRAEPQNSPTGTTGPDRRMCQQQAAANPPATLRQQRLRAYTGGQVLPHDR
jgi:hypothetical protein